MNRMLDQVRQCLEVFKMSGIDLIPTTYGFNDSPSPLVGEGKDGGAVANRNAPPFQITPHLHPPPQGGRSHDTLAQDQLQILSRDVSSCIKCPELVKRRTQVVFGSGNPHAALMFVGEAPGHEEDLQGLPFVGPAGQLLTKIIESIGLKREEVYIANVLKCRPSGNRNPLPDEILNCRPYLLNQIELIEPKIICALGTFAAQTLLATSELISSLRGRFFDFHGARLICTYHPAYLLRSPSEKRKVWEDMKLIRAELV